jgi:HEPN domain-containing protein
MKPETAEWVAKAEGDLHTARRELSATDLQNYDAACFHAQQCVEKYLKARLVEAGLPFPKTHDLEALLNLALPIEPTWEELRTTVQVLTNMAVEVRYPGMDADAEDAAVAVKAAESVRGSIRVALKIEEE